MNDQYEVSEDIKTAFAALETAYNNMYSCLINSNVPMSRFIHPDEKQFSQLQTPTTGHFMLAFLRQELGIKLVLPPFNNTETVKPDVKSIQELMAENNKGSFNTPQENLLNELKLKPLSALRLPEKLMEKIIASSGSTTVGDLMLITETELLSILSSNDIAKIKKAMFDFGIDTSKLWRF